MTVAKIKEIVAGERKLHSAVCPICEFVTDVLDGEQILNQCEHFYSCSRDGKFVFLIPEDPVEKITQRYVDKRLTTYVIEEATCPFCNTETTIHHEVDRRVGIDKCQTKACKHFDRVVVTGRQSEGTDIVDIRWRKSVG